jgi:hypothetical protein
MERKSYLEARQRADLRRDIAARLLPTEGPYSPGDRVYDWQVDKSKIKHGVTSGRWYKGRVLSQEGAICVIDTGTTVLRVNQSRLRKEKGMESQPDLVSHGKSDLPSDSTDTGHSVPSVYWIGPRHASVDVLELSDGLRLFTSICHQQGLLTGKCVSLKGRFSQSSDYATAWNIVLETSPVLLVH